MRIKELHNWRCVDLYNEENVLPNKDSLRIKGNVFNHENFEDGSVVIISTPKSFDGQFVTTQSGSVYRLMNPDVDYTFEFIDKDVVHELKEVLVSLGE